MVKKNLSATIVLLGMVAVLVSCFTRPPSEKKPEAKPLAAATGAICETVPQPASAATEPTPAPVKPASEPAEKPLSGDTSPGQGTRSRTEAVRVMSPSGNVPSVAAAPKSLPRMWDFGSENCLPCKTMLGILTPMIPEFAGKVDVRIINVYSEPALAKEHRIQIIPTQVFLDTTGTELWRHIGVLTRDTILLKFREFGFAK